MALLDMTAAAAVYTYQSRERAKQADWDQRMAAMRAEGERQRAVERLSEQQREDAVKVTLPSDRKLESRLRAAVQNCTRKESDAIIRAVFQYASEHPEEVMWASDLGNGAWSYFMNHVLYDKTASLCTEEYFERVAERDGREALEGCDAARGLAQFEDAAVEVLLNMAGRYSSEQLEKFQLKQTEGKELVPCYERLLGIRPRK